MKLVDPGLCTGCGACKTICPKDAIVFADDAAGFPSPCIQTDVCIECGACERVCPALHPPKTEPIRKAYAAQLKDAEVLKRSTSGGLFTAFSREIFRRGGVVYGCVWDESCHAVITRAENETGILPMRGSKYVWSAAYPVFQQVKVDLDAGRYVLYVGNPCQIAGLKGYLRKEYENLFLLDFLCSGAPSPLALDKYLDTVCAKADRPELDLKFRDKEPFGVGVHITYKGKKQKTLKNGEQFRNPYYYAFYTRLTDRDSCYSCPYGGEDRVADLTMGDYWGIGNYHPEMRIREGVSALLINSAKGEALLEAVKNNLYLTETKPEQIGAANNLYVGGKIRNVHRPVNRDAFFEELKNNGWKTAETRFLRTKGRALRLLSLRMSPKIAWILKWLVKGK